MTSVLANRIEASRKSTSELEADVAGEHEQAMLCWELEEQAAEIVALFDDMKRHIERRHRSVSETADANQHRSDASTVQWFNLYQNLFEIAERTARLIKALEQRGYVIEGKLAFASMLGDLRSICSFSLEQVRSASKLATGGSGMELGEFLVTLPRDTLA